MALNLPLFLTQRRLQHVTLLLTSANLLNITRVHQPPEVILVIAAIQSQTQACTSDSNNSSNTNGAKAMAHRDLPKHQRDLIVKRYQSGEGYKRISKALDVPWNTVKTVIINCRKYGTTVTLPRTGCPSKIDEKTRRKLVREATKRPTATLKELQQYLASTGCLVHVTTISRILHMSGLWGRVARRKPFLT
uniref:Transposase Tc1-like domain-containing protein n=1 Tax=Xenopus tropicalis TaxID=8364 RepID=A0A803JMT1_XENTR